MKKIIIKIIIALILFIFSIFSSYKIGFNNGLDKMFFAVTDTIQTIINNQIKSDTSVTELIIINPDTNVYYLSRKTVLNK